MLPLVARNRSRRHATPAAIATSTLLLLLLSSCSSSAAASSANATQTCEFRTINYITDSLPQQCLTSAWRSSNGSATVTTFAAASANANANANATSVGSAGGGDAEGISVTTITTVEVSSPSSGGSAVEGQESASGEAVASEPASASSSSSVAVTTTTQTASQAAEASATDLEVGELNDASFLSFEEWKKQTLEKAGQQQNGNVGSKRSGENKRKDSESVRGNLESLGDEGEIDLDFGAFQSDKKEREADKSAQDGEVESKQKAQEGAVAKSKDQYRSRDAGKTCKERFSYASFDAGATILKTHQGAKNAKAVLNENKDSYMLSECRTQNKFLIIELSEDIWIDTLVLANYEFFSSTVRTFRVSVSDRYPVKMEKWKDLGVYEARNSREIQAFLIENPQIWARYIRIEFLTHYGNEYYCPLSLVRVHGSRMLESWKETEANNDDDDEDEAEDSARTIDEQFVPEAVDVVVQQEERISAELKEAQAAISELVKTAQSITPEGVEPALVTSHLKEANISLQEATSAQMTTPWIPGFDFGAWMNVSQGLDVCLPKEAPATIPTPSSITSTETVTSFTGPCTESSTAVVGSSPAQADTANVSAASSIKVDTPVPSKDTTTGATSISAPALNGTSSSASQPDSSSSQSATVSVSTKSQNMTSSVKTKTSATSSSASALPTQQESFFKAVSRRLQLLETNSTLSLKYIEEQSKILREAFTKVEKKQLQKSTTFLETLNSTVLKELKEIRQQYDEIWQSTVISLESQRDESRREILAISSRLNILADEVVFQKRMSIVQSVLLLLCLGLVIFSRVSSGGHLDFNSRLRLRSPFPIESPIEIESPPGSPEYLGQRYSANGRPGQWGRANSYPVGIPEDIAEFEEGEDEDGEEVDEDEEGEYEEDEEHVIDESPPTPVSSYSRSEKSFSPPSGDEISTPYGLSPQQQTPLQTSSSKPSIRTLKRSPSSSYQKYQEELQNGHEPPDLPSLDQLSPSPSPFHTPSKKHKRPKRTFSNSQRQQQQEFSPPPEDHSQPASFNFISNSSPPVNLSFSPTGTPQGRSRSLSHVNGNTVNGNGNGTSASQYSSHPLTSPNQPSSSSSSSTRTTTIPIVTTTPASPPPPPPRHPQHSNQPGPPAFPSQFSQPEGDQGAGVGVGEGDHSHRRRSDSQSFNIARKPLPPLPPLSPVSKGEDQGGG